MTAMITLDIYTDPCNCDTITTPVPEIGTCAVVGRRDASEAKTSSKFAHGGPRENSGGARPNCGGPQPGSGRPRKPKPIVLPAYAPAIPVWCVLSFWGQAEIPGITDLTRQGYDTYLPMVAVHRRDPVIATMFRVVRVPYIPGYGFIRLTQSESREPILATRGIREVLRRPDGRAAWVSDGEIDQLRSKDIERLELPKERGPVLDVGTLIRVEEGPFADRPGTVVECDGVKTKVDIEIFGRTTPVWLDRTSVAVV